MTRIDTSNWREFKLKELFITNKKGDKLQVPTGANVPIKDLRENGNIPRITVTGINNGVIGYFDYIGDKKSDYRVYNNFISVSFLGTVFYQEGDASLDMKVHCLKPIDFTLNQYTGRYLVSVIKSSLQESSYADQISSTVLPEISIQLPVTKENFPDFDYMDSYMRNLEDSVSASLTALQLTQFQENKKIDVREWGEFLVEEIFESINIAKSYDFGKLREGSTVFINRSGNNNGIQGFVNVEPTERKHCITIGMVGNSKSAFWQTVDFAASQNILILRNKRLNEYSGHFLCSVFNSLLQDMRNYETIIKKDEFKKQKIKLPITQNGDPDYKFMEEYMKSIYEDKVADIIDGISACLDYKLTKEDKKAISST